MSVNKHMPTDPWSLVPLVYSLLIGQLNSASFSGSGVFFCSESGNLKRSNEVDLIQGSQLKFNILPGHLAIIGDILVVTLAGGDVRATGFYKVKAGVLLTSHNAQDSLSTKDFLYQDIISA